MPSSSGPNLAGKSSLIFSYNVNDVQNSYKGEPTTNLIPSATINALPTYGNGWGSYNTNQYGSGTYFSIGTVSSVSSNIVTMTAAHSLRSYDVMQPQTTGGGVTAGVNYYIKKISSTQFSIHEYNSSQDGSQGYINPATGTFKVHDSIATDTRVSINATSFPTMWWGYPHLPNSGLVKEIIPNGYTVPGKGIKTDCMRHHVFRSDGVADGMAYGVDGSFTPNSPIYISFYARANTSSAVGQGIYFYNYTYNVVAANGYAFTATLGPVGEWRRFGYTFTSPNNAVISYWFPPGTSTPYSYDIANIQIEQKDRPTTFTTSSRSNTASLIPLVGTSSIDVTNVSFTSNSTITFDGTNDYINLGNLGTIGSTYSIECVFNSSSVTSYKNIFDMNYSTYPGVTGNVGPRLEQITGQGITFIWSGNVSNNNLYNSTSLYNISSNTNYHVVFVQNGNSGTIYVNGVQHSQVSNAQGYIQTFGDVSLGRGFSLSSRYFEGTLPVFKIYNKVLLSQEIIQNYKQYKTRFNLS